MSMILDAFVSKLLHGLIALVRDEVTMLLGVTDEIERLQKTLEKINLVLADAERKKIQSKAIDDWLKKLKDIMYDADDECRIEAEKSKADINLAPLVALALVSRKTSPVAEVDIVGPNIEKDTDKLVELLVEDARENNILVYAIVGIGGLGKTTLARRIFNDERITTNFPMKLWICVSKEFEENSLLKDVIRQAGGNSGGDSSKAQLEIEVENSVTNKKFLLVLDDLWEPKVWSDLLRNPLQRGATGSRVLVTTRNEAVALQMKAVKPHHQVEALSAEVGWELLCKNVVSRGEEGEIEDLKDIGEEIVEKCGGLPLAIKTIGGVLSAKSRTKKEWDKVLKVLLNNAESMSGLPEGVQPVLYLSYEDLPSQVKQCFLYCSLFPEDYEFHRRFLIHFRISEGFIHEEGNRTFEEQGEDYYGDLVQRSFFQPHPWSYDHPRCTVHDLLWSLARFLARDENTVLKGGVEVQVHSPSVKPRRLQGYVTKEKRQAFIDALEGHDSLRTLLLCLGGSQVEENDVNNVIKKTPRLRVLDLSGSGIVKLPGSLGNLIHLRYLALSDSYITEIPESIENLVNLQFLILQVCKNLRSLPKGIGKLHNLRSLDLIETELDGIPIEIAHLHRLNTLIDFVVRNNSSNSGWCTLEELRPLRNLELLVIMKLERALNEGEVRLIALPKLRELTLYNCPKLRSLPSGLVHHATTLIMLQISYCHNLKAIRGFSSVKELEISYSCNLEDVSDLPRLKLLKLEDHEMRSLPEWFHGGQLDFPLLNKLEIIASDQQLRRCLEDGSDWPKIEHIRYVSAKNHDGSRYISKSPSGFSNNLNDYVEDE
uniref:Disease resistance protein RGA3 n=1 Tax=Elaeis guineensis var. tenera TaxID=51953 RepID=A0A6J0PB27_ELAGV|nr:putative disease resistance protein RGA3 [Elaeis guineensis]